MPDMDSFSARDTSSFVRDTDGAHLSSRVEIFLFRRDIVGVDLQLFDKCLQFTIVTYS